MSKSGNKTGTNIAQAGMARKDACNRMHAGLRMSPAMAAGVTDRLWKMSDIVALIDAWEEPPNRAATFKKRV
jgi:hypothetical protein